MKKQACPPFPPFKGRRLWYLIVLSNFLFFNLAQGQYYFFENRFTCENKDPDLISKGNNQIKNTLSQMQKEGTLFKFNADRDKQGDTLILSYHILSESASQFKNITNTWLKKFEEKDPEFFKTFNAACPSRKDTLARKEKYSFPFFKNTFWDGAFEVEGIEEFPDKKQKYNLLFDLTSYPTLSGNEDKFDSSKVNWGLRGIGRIMNLHGGAGIPKKNINFVVVVHAWGIHSFLNHEAYRKKFGTDNPNLPVIEELSELGIKFFLCGQNLTWSKIKKEELSPWGKIAFSAQTVLSTYALKGYMYKKISND